MNSLETRKITIRENGKSVEIPALVTLFLKILRFDVFEKYIKLLTFDAESKVG
jgi:hypothetical protein